MGQRIFDVEAGGMVVRPVRVPLSIVTGGGSFTSREGI